MVFLAFSLQDQVEKYGAYVGVAAFFGLAVLSLLYFSQARELRRLRDWAGRAPERAQELEARVTAQAEEALRGEPVAAATAAAGARAASSVGGGAATQVVEETGQAAAAQSGNGTTHAAELAEGSLNGVTSASSDPGSVVETSAAGEAAQVAAEPEHPAPEEAEPAEGPAAEAAEPAGEPAAEAAEPAGEPAAEEPEAAPPAAAEGDQPAVPPVVAAGEGAAEEVVEVGPQGEAAQTGEAPEETQAHDALEAEEEEPEVPPVPRATPVPRRAPAAALRQPDRSATLPPRRPAPARLAEPEGDSHKLRNGLLAGAGLLVILVGVLFATGVLGGGGDKPASPNQVTSGTSSSSGSGTGASSPAEPALTPKSTRIQVLNGTTVQGLASTEAEKLRTAGFTGKVGTGNNTVQQIADSSVMYGTRRGARTQARTVARQLDITTVKRMDSDTRDLSGNADVAVILGQDKAP
jgi:hypothetical protein